MNRHLTLIRLLADGQFHSGEVIARHLGLSRVAIWKALRKSANHYGLALESVRGRGYRLAAPLELLDSGRIRALLSPAGRAMLTRLDIHDQIDSTNACLMREAALGALAGTVCLAERQTAGRGRRGRPWISPFGSNLYLSILWRYPLAPAALGGASLAIGAVVAGVLRRIETDATGASALTLKWPNDLLWQGCKLAGLLLEVAGESQGPSHLVMGLGVNLRMEPTQGQHIDQPWTDLSQMLSGHAINRNQLVAQLLDALLSALDVYGRDGLEPFLAQWREFDALLGQPVRLRLGDQVIEGLHAGIANDGSLQLQTLAGLKRFQAGEVSLRTSDHRPEALA